MREDTGALCEKSKLPIASGTGADGMFSSSHNRGAMQYQGRVVWEGALVLAVVTAATYILQL